MNFKEVTEAVETAKSTIIRGDEAARQLASLLRGRLRVAQIGEYILADLKRELRNFNMQTGEWKDD